LCPTEVTEVVILLQIRHGHVSASHYLISEIPEFGLPKGMYKRPEIPEFGNSGIAVTIHAGGQLTPLHDPPLDPLQRPSLRKKR